MRRVIMVGGGAAGMMAAVFAAKQGAQVDLYEKNEKLGKKLYITGKGRCNLTNNCEVEELLRNVRSNAKFLYSGFYGFTAQDAMEFFQEAGLALKTERGNRVFPVSDHAYDVTAALERSMKALGVRVHLNREVERLLIQDGEIQGVLLKEAGASGGSRKGSSRKALADAVVVATGGLSYPVTGSTGDGYEWARDAGHEVTKLLPSLVPMNVKEDWVRELMGLSLRNVQITIYRIHSPPDSETKACRLCQLYLHIKTSCFAVQPPRALELLPDYPPFERFPPPGSRLWTNQTSDPLHHLLDRHI